MNRLIGLILGAVLPFAVNAGEVTVAVASNFLDTAQRISVVFERETGHSVALVNGSTGTLFAQIRQGAPYDVFLSADRARIVALVEAGAIAEGATKTYAFGKLVLLARDPALIVKGDVAATLAGDYRRFALANPALAPYGLAAQQVLERLDLGINGKAVTASNAAQAALFLQTGNVEIGFLALSQLGGIKGAWFEIPTQYYDPIEQVAGRLVRADGNQAAAAFFDFLSTDLAQSVIAADGYGVPE